jgi:hypothetical protein
VLLKAANLVQLYNAAKSKLDKNKLQFKLEIRNKLKLKLDSEIQFALLKATNLKAKRLLNLIKI